MTENRILFVLNSLEIGGAERMTVSVAKHINRLPDYRSYVCSLCGLGPFFDSLKNDNIKVYQLKKRPQFKPGNSWRLARFIKKEKIDIVTSINSAPLRCTYFASLFVPDMKILHVDQGRSFPNPKKYRPSMKFLSTRIHKIIAVSEELKSSIVKFEHVQPERIRVIYNRIDGSLFEAPINAADKKTELGLPLNKLVIGTGVRLAEQKGITYLLKAIALLAHNRNDFCVVIAGDGPLRAALEQETHHLGIQNLIHFIGERTDIHEVIQLFDIYVLPSLWEGLPLVLPEAQAAKRPIIATSVGGTPKVIEDGRNGLLVPPKDPDRLAEAIKELLESPAKRKTFANSGHETFLEKFSLEMSVKEYLEEYKAMLNK